jgi:hypothetical protein
MNRDMPIVTMVSKDEYDKHPGDPTYFIGHDASRDEKKNGPLYMHRMYDGLVLAKGEHNFSDDSDFYAIVWDPVEKKPKEVEYATTRAWTYPNNAEVDASPEVMKAYESYVTELSEKRARNIALAKAHEVKPGKMVTVVHGRKVPIGTVGTVVWEEEIIYSERPRTRRYPQGFHPEVKRVVISTDNGKNYWTNASNVEVLLPEDHPKNLCPECRSKERHG